MKCPKCSSPNVYQQDGENACMMCGTRFPRQFIKKEETVGEKKRDKKVCRNCERVAVISGDGLCGRCYYAVWKVSLKNGTPEYDAALAEAKIKIMDPYYRIKRPGQILPENIKKLKTKAKVLLKIKRNGGDPEMSGVIATMQMERERLLAKADKLAQAIELLQ